MLFEVLSAVALALRINAGHHERRKEMPIPENTDLLLTELRISIPIATKSIPLNEISKCHNIVIELNKPNRLELTFNHGKQRIRKHLRSKIPLVFNW